jgi:hypothetical protein
VGNAKPAQQRLQQALQSARESIMNRLLTSVAAAAVGLTVLAGQAVAQHGHSGGHGGGHGGGPGGGHSIGHGGGHKTGHGVRSQGTGHGVGHKDHGHKGHTLGHGGGRAGHRGAKLTARHRERFHHLGRKVANRRVARIFSRLAAGYRLTRTEFQTLERFVGDPDTLLVPGDQALIREVLASYADEDLLADEEDADLP